VKIKPDKVGFAADKPSNTREIVITASRSNEKSGECPRLGHGVFSYYFLQSLNLCSSSVDTNQDRKLSFNELYKYTLDKVSQRSCGTQNPTFYEGPEVEDRGIFRIKDDGELATIKPPPAPIVIPTTPVETPVVPVEEEEEPTVAEEPPVEEEEPIIEEPPVEEEEPPVVEEPPVEEETPTEIEEPPATEEPPVEEEEEPPIVEEPPVEEEEPPTIGEPPAEEEEAPAETEEPTVEEEEEPVVEPEETVTTIVEAPTTPVEEPSEPEEEEYLGGILQALSGMIELAGQSEGPEYDLVAEIDKTSYAPNDRVNLTVSVDDECYIYMINIFYDGEVNLLFPNGNVTDNLVQAGENLTTEDITGGYHFRVKPESAGGTEYLLVIASPIELPIEGLLSQKYSKDNPIVELKHHYGTRGVLSRIIDATYEGCKPLHLVASDGTFVGGDAPGAVTGHSLAVEVLEYQVTR
jgi:hypothetical protein